MTILHAQLIGDKAVRPRKEFEQLVELARRSEAIRLRRRKRTHVRGGH